jgi:hypothetical protein
MLPAQRHAATFARAPQTRLRCRVPSAPNCAVVGVHSGQLNFAWSNQERPDPISGRDKESSGQDGQLLDSFDPDESANYFKNSGYEQI